MSFISVVVSNELLSVMADKRESTLDIETKILSPETEMTNKLHRVGKYGFYATSINNLHCNI